MIVVVTVMAGCAAGWATYMLRDDLRPRHDREVLWRRVILTRREDLRAGAAVCGAVATCGGLAGSLLGERAAALSALSAVLAAAALASDVVSLMPATDRRLVVYRDISRAAASAANRMPLAQPPPGRGARRLRPGRGDRCGSRPGQCRDADA